MNFSKAETRLTIFGASCRIVIHNPHSNADSALEAARNELLRVDDKFCALKSESVVAQINQSAGTGSYTPLDAESQSLFKFVTALWNESNHLFDPTTHLLHDCYDEQGSLLASSDQLKNMLKLVGWSKLDIDERGAHLSQKGMLIDLNSCVRPYAIDCARKVLTAQNIGHALIEMDRDTASIGKQADGANWLVGLKHPRGALSAITRVKLNDRGLSLRGDFEQSVLIGGERFGRALSPVDGHPLPGMLGVAVVTDSCLAACSAANVARLRSAPNAVKWLEKLGYPWLAIDRDLNCLGPLSPA